MPPQQRPTAGWSGSVVEQTRQVATHHLSSSSLPTSMPCRCAQYPPAPQAHHCALEHHADHPVVASAKRLPAQCLHGRGKPHEQRQPCSQKGAQSRCRCGGPRSHRRGGRQGMPLTSDIVQRGCQHCGAQLERAQAAHHAAQAGQQQRQHVCSVSSSSATHSACLHLRLWPPQHATAHRTSTPPGQLRRQPGWSR